MTDLYLYNVTLQPPSAITCTALGNFVGGKTQEIAVARGEYLELLQPDPNTGRVNSLIRTNCFGYIRSMCTFRITGGSKGRV